MSEQGIFTLQKYLKVYGITDPHIVKSYRHIKKLDLVIER